MVQTYKFSSKSTNSNKIQKIYELSFEYKRYYNILMKKSIQDFFKEGKLHKYLPPLSIGKLSERYKQTCGSQVRSNIESWLTNIGNRCNEVISKYYRGNKNLIPQFYYINKYHLWFQNEMKIKNNFISQDIIKLSRKVFKHFMFKIPVMHSCCMILDHKVAQVEISKNTFDYWIKLSTLVRGKVIYLPVKSYDYYNNIKGKNKNTIQIKVSPDTIEYGFIKDIEDIEYKGTSTIGIDIGLVNTLSSSGGSQYGKRLFPLLKKYDAIINSIIKDRMKKGLYESCPKLNRLYSKVRNLVKNEIGRCLNRLIELERPKIIVIENVKNINKTLKCKNPEMRRILLRSGFSKIGKRLVNKCEIRKIKVVEVNPAYTSQRCPVCGFVHKDNRKYQECFKCLNCGYTRNADYVASVNICDRRSVTNFNTYTPYRKVKEILEREFLSAQAVYSAARGS